MLKLQRTFIQRAPGEILVYNINKLFFAKVERHFLSKNVTYNELGRIFGLKGKKPGKNLWAWKKGITGIPLSAVRILIVKDNNFINELNELNLVFGERRSKHKIVLPTLSKNLAYLIGLISRDGNIQRYFTRIVDEYKENLECANHILRKEFKVPTIIRKETDRKWLLELNSRVISEFFDKSLEVPIGTKEKICVPSIIKKSKNEIKFAYIKGWMDAESSVEQWFKTKNKWYLKICFKVKNKAIWKWITEELEKNNIIISKFRDNEGSYRFQILRKNSAKEYMKHIGFLYQTKLNKIKTLMKTP